MKAALLFCAVFILTHASYESDFASWVSSNNKAYASDEEYQYRLSVFSSNMDKIQALNEESDGGAIFAVNKFADLTGDEFTANYKGYKPTAWKVQRDLELEEVDAAPATFDWEPTGKVTPVKNQEQCGSCWAFSATENIESVWMIAKDLTNANFKPLAPQQIVDCDTDDGGCNGGDTITAYEYVIKAGGQDTEASYPYKAVNQACHFKAADVEVKIASYKYVGKNNEEDMKTGVATVAPLSICVDAEPWQFYSGGIMKKAQCGTSLDHCVQITAYDTSSATPYWNVRNSWGTDWGEKGFIRLEFGTNTCGVAIEPTTAVVA
jgi:C1A family cysteine protease